MQNPHVERAARRAVFQLVELVADRGADDAALVVRRPRALASSSSEAISATSKSAAALQEIPERRCAAHQPVRRQNLQAGRVHVDERHHHAIGAGERRVFARKAMAVS